MPKSFLKSLGNTFVGGLLQTGFGQLNNAINYSRQLDFWNRQNEYNSPLAQRKRLQQAGFNPAAFSGEVASSSPAQGLSSINQDNPDIDSLNESLMLFGQLEQMNAGTELTKSQIELAAIQYIVENEKAFGLKLDNKEKEILLKYVEDGRLAEIYEALSRIRNLDSGTQKNEAETFTEDATREGKVATLSAQVAESESRTALNEALTADSNMLRGAKLAEMESNVAKASAEIEKIGWDNLYSAYGENAEVLNSAASKFFGIDMSSLPGELRAYAQSLMQLCSLSKDDGSPALSVEAAYQSLGAQIDRYVDKQGRYPESSSYSSEPGVKVGKFSLGLGKLSESRTR